MHDHAGISPERQASEELHLEPIHSEILRKAASLVKEEEFGTSELLSIVDGMLQKMKLTNQQAESRKDEAMVGLAAPQVGIDKAIAIVWLNDDTPDDEPDILTMINPVIVESSEQEEFGLEGCHSSGDFWAEVKRPVWTIVKFQTTDGEWLERRIEGDFNVAKVFHELDHLKGIRPPDHIADGTARYLSKGLTGDNVAQYKQDKEAFCAMPAHHTTNQEWLIVSGQVERAA